MEEETGRSMMSDRPKKNDAYNKVVKAGKRTYFFDVKTTTPGDELFLVITESKKCTDNEGHFFYEKHKIFLFPEDIETFFNGLSQVKHFMKTNNKKKPLVIPKQKANNDYSEIKETLNEQDNQLLEESFSTSDVDVSHQ